MPERELPVPVDEFVRKLELAKLQRVELRPAPRSGIAMIASRPGSPDEYVVGPDSCSCPAGQLSGVFCKHRAMWINHHIADYAHDLIDKLAQLNTPRTGRGAA